MTAVRPYPDFLGLKLKRMTAVRPYPDFLGLKLKRMTAVRPYPDFLGLKLKRMLQGRPFPAPTAKSANNHPRSIPPGSITHDRPTFSTPPD
jgi:hypothetical protein